MKYKFVWNKSEKPLTSDTILINCKTIAFIVCSIISAFINLTFISNMTKADYSIGVLLSIPAAVLLGTLSIGLDLVKCLHAIQVNTLNELHRKLSSFKWSNKVKNVSRKWFTFYIFYVILSVITSVSLSSISIGAGITRNANTLKQIDEFISQGEVYYSVDSTTKNINMQNLIGKATDTSEQDAIAFVNKQVSEVWPKLQEWQTEYTEFKNKGFNPDSKKEIEYNGQKIIPYDYWTEKNRTINNLLSSSKYSTSKVSEYNLSRITQAAFEANIKENYLKLYKSVNTDIAVKQLGELKDDNKKEAYNWVVTLNNIGFIDPRNGKQIEFDIDEGKDAKILVQSALTRLKTLRVEIENDSGDIGSSSKIFMQLGSWIDSFKKTNTTDLNEALNVKTESSFGSTEVMMMSMLLFLSLLCEIAINQFSPKTTISRKLLNQFSQYFPKDFDVNSFMLDVYIEQYNYGQMTKEKFDSSVEETLRMMDITKSKLISDYKKKNLISVSKEEVKEIVKKATEKKVAKPKKPVEKKEKKIEVNIPIPDKTITITDEPVETVPVEKEETKSEEKNNKMVVKFAEKEIAQMLEK